VDDELLLLRLLEANGVEVAHLRVEEPDALRQALEKPWDVVISDYHLPKLDALRALDLVRAVDQDVPFIVVSGNVGEDLAVAAMTRQLLSFSRKSVLDPRLLDLNEVTAASEKMLRRLLGPRIDYQTRPTPEPGYVIADRGLIEQVLVNLIVNARDAMPGGGT